MRDAVGGGWSRDRVACFNCRACPIVINPTTTLTHSIFHVYGSDAPSLSSRVWVELDAIPFVMRSRGYTLDERASTAVRQAVVTCVRGSTAV